MELTISLQIDNQIQKASQLLGLNKNELIERAILYYLSDIMNNLNLRQEFEDWDNLSDEALNNFEKKI